MFKREHAEVRHNQLHCVCVHSSLLGSLGNMNGQGASSYQAKFQRAGSGFADMITWETVEESE